MIRTRLWRIRWACLFHHQLFHCHLLHHQPTHRQSFLPNHCHYRHSCWSRNSKNKTKTLYRLGHLVYRVYNSYFPHLRNSCWISAALSDWNKDTINMVSWSLQRHYAHYQKPELCFNIQNIFIKSWCFNVSCQVNWNKFHTHLSCA